MGVLDRFASPRFNRTAAGVLLALVGLRALWLLSAAWGYDTDDAFITLRYAHHWADGHGIVWNVGEAPVEGYSNFLSLVLARIAFAVGADPLVALKAIGAISLLASAGLAYLIARRFVGPLAATIPAILITAHRGQLMWAVTGLESSLYTAWVLASVYALVRGLGFSVRPVEGDEPDPSPPDWRWLYAAGGFAFVAAIARAEGPVVAIAIGLAALYHFGVRRQWRDALKVVGVFAISFAAPFAVYFAWRWWYFGRLLPNSVYCKAGFDANPYAIVHAFWQDAKPLLLVSLAFPWRRFDARHVVVLALTLAYAVMMIGADPVLSFWNRYFLPVLALLGVTFAAGLSNIAGIVLPRASLPQRGVVAALAVLLWTGSLVEDTFEPLQQRTKGYQRRMKARAELAAALTEQMGPDDWYVIGDAGLVPYLTDGYVLDAFCLNNAAMTRPPIDRSPERFLDDMFEREPPFIVVHSALPDRMAPRPEHDAVYPRMVKRPELREHYQVAGVWGAPGDPFHYWVFRRATGEPR